MPVIYAAAGNCHVYVDASADPEMAQRVAFNAKVQRPGVCNASETLLVHAEAAPAVLPGLLEAPSARRASSFAPTAARARSPGRWATSWARRPRRTGRPSTSA